MTRLDSLEMLEPPDREAWRHWLEAHHQTSDGVWLAVGKKGNTRTRLTYEDAVQEALRFGWIDSIVRTLDADRYKQLFTPRKARSTWSASNKRRVEELEAAGLMTPAGRAAVEAAKSNGAWTSLDDVEALVMPDDLEAALAAEKGAAEKFARMPDSQRKMALYWIAAAKREATRRTRIDKTVDAALRGKPPV